MAYILDPPKDMCIVMHWCPGTLYKRLHVKREELSILEAIRIARETAQVWFAIKNLFLSYDNYFWKISIITVYL